MGHASASSSQARGGEAWLGEDLRGVQVESWKKSHQGQAVSTKEEEWQDLGKVGDGVSVLSSHRPGPTTSETAHQAKNIGSKPMRGQQQHQRRLWLGDSWTPSLILIERT